MWSIPNSPPANDALFAGLRWGLHTGPKVSKMVSPGHDFSRGPSRSSMGFLPCLLRTGLTGQLKDREVLLSSKPWFAFYPGDYVSKTRSLSMLEHGAYWSLLTHYYSTGKALPLGMDRICRIVGATMLDEQKAVLHVMKTYFVEQDDGHHNKRADRELAIRAEFHDKLSKAGRKGGLSKATSLAQACSQPQPQSHINSKPLASSVPLSAGGAKNGICYIPLLDNSEWGVSQDYLGELEAAYPAVDGPATLKEIRAWCLSNPGRRKTLRGVRRFINAWFAKDQNHG